MSNATPILHMLDPRKHVSPFDVNMAADAGFKVIVPYTNVEIADEFSRMIQTQAVYNANALAFRTNDELTITARDLARA